MIEIFITEIFDGQKYGDFVGPCITICQRTKPFENGPEVVIKCKDNDGMILLAGFILDFCFGVDVVKR